MTIAIHPHYRKNKDVSMKLLRSMIKEVPENGLGIALHSQKVNPNIPFFAKIASGGCIEGEELDHEVLSVYKWARQKPSF